jgi:hypothetical protein
MSIVVWVPLTGLPSGLPALTGVASGTPLPANAIAVPEGYDPADPDGLWDLFPTDQEATYAQSYTPIAVATPFNISEAVEGVTLSGGTVQVLTYSLAPVATAVTGVTLSGGTITQTMALDLPAAGVAVAGVAPQVLLPDSVDVPSSLSLIAGVAPSVSAEPDPILLLHFDGTNNSTTIVDSSPSAKTVTVHGNAKLTTGALVFGTASATFDGSGDYMQIASSGGVDLIGGSFSIDCRIRYLVNKVSTRLIALGGGSTAFNGTNGVHLLIQRNGATDQRRLNVQWWDGTSNVSVNSPVGSLPANTDWHHISVAVDHAAGLIYLGVNGSVTSHTWTGVRPSDAPILTLATIPGEGGNTTFALNGQMDELRILDNYAAYTSDYTVPTVPYRDPGVADAATANVVIAGVVPRVLGDPVIDVPGAVVAIAAIAPEIINTNAIPATYSQRSVYIDNTAATAPGMTNGITAETTQTGTDYHPDADGAWLQMDFGSVMSFSSVVVGCDFNNTLAGGWGKAYAEDCDIIGSNDATTWTTLGNTGTFSTALKTISTPAASYRYVRIRRTDDYLAVTEFYALT